MADKCPHCGMSPTRIPTRISTYAMYDAHFFVELKANTPEGLLAEVPTHRHEKYGTPEICSVIVLDQDDKEIRRVGPCFLYPRNDQKWLDAVKADPDVMRLLAERKP